jgi:hypothetical protein
LLQIIHDELNENKRNKELTNIESNKECAEIEYYIFRQNYDNKNKSIISDTFCFEQVCINHCPNCEKNKIKNESSNKNAKAESFSFEMKNQILIDLYEFTKKEFANNINIDDLVKFYLRSKESKISCPICGNVYHSNKYELKLNSCPDVLTFVFINADKKTKNNFHIKPNEEIDLKNYLFKWNNNKKIQTEYELMGIANDYINFAYCNASGGKK